MNNKEQHYEPTDTASDDASLAEAVREQSFYDIINAIAAGVDISLVGGDALVEDFLEAHLKIPNDVLDAYYQARTAGE